MATTTALILPDQLRQHYSTTTTTTILGNVDNTPPGQLRQDPTWASNFRNTLIFDFPPSGHLFMSAVPSNIWPLISIAILYANGRLLKYAVGVLTTRVVRPTDPFLPRTSEVRWLLMKSHTLCDSRVKYPTKYILKM